MTRLEKRVVLALGVVLALLVVLLRVYSWWANIPPKRPGDVAADAVFIPSLPTPFPASKHGNWVSCWFDPAQNVDLCRVTDSDGHLRYEGAFIPYKGQVTVPGSDVIIDAEATNDNWFQKSVWVREELVPLVSLRNGQILIPKEAYQAGKKRLDELQAGRADMYSH
jgi:hypothetical protein